MKGPLAHYQKSTQNVIYIQINTKIEGERYF